LAWAQSSLCFGDIASFQGDTKHRACGCAAENCIEGSCCCGHHVNVGFNLCGCSDTRHNVFLSGTPFVTSGVNSLRGASIVETSEGVLYAATFTGARLSYSSDYSGMGVLLRTCSLRS